MSALTNAAYVLEDSGCLGVIFAIMLTVTISRRCLVDLDWVIYRFVFKGVLL